MLAFFLLVRQLSNASSMVTRDGVMRLPPSTLEHYEQHSVHVIRYSATCPFANPADFNLFYFDSVQDCTALYIC